MDARIGKKIAETRKRAGVALDDLARDARVPLDELAVLESGEPARVSTAAIARLARALDVDVADWAGDQPIHRSQPALFFKQSGVPDFFDADRIDVVGALREARSIVILDRMLGKEYKRATFDPVDVATPPYRQGYDLANKVRRVLGQPVQPLGSVSHLVEDEFGVPVLAAALNARRVLALTAKERGTDLVAVILNAARTENRRVDIAHEITHILFDAAEKDIDYWLDIENEHESDSSAVEQRARAFAAEFLIPRLGLLERLGPPKDRPTGERNSLARARELVMSVAAHFYTPPELTTNHLVNHNYIYEDLKDSVWQGLNPPPAPRAKQRPKMLHRRIAEALGEGLITQMRARELLGLSARDELPAQVWQR